MSDRTRDLQVHLGRFAVIAALAAASCGWTVGRPPAPALTVGPVGGAAIQPGLRAQLEDALVTAASRRGIASGGPRVRVEVVSSEDRVQAGSRTAGGVAWEASLTVSASVDGRPGCSVEAGGRRTWIAVTTDLEGVPVARADAYALLAAEVADRTLDALLADVECR